MEPDAEIILAATTEEAIAAISSRSTRIGAAARARALAAHTAAHRAAQLEAHLAEALTWKTAPITTALKKRSRRPMINSHPLTLVAGGAGFIGSHLCAELLARGHHVVCVDNLQTARASNLQLLQNHSHFEFVEADIVNPLPREILYRTGQFDRVYNLACAASPPQYQADPEHTC